MVENTSVDYWTCIDLAQALDQVMRNDLWDTADRIAMTARRIADPPSELVEALYRYDLHAAANSAADRVEDAPPIEHPATRSYSQAG